MTARAVSRRCLLSGLSAAAFGLDSARAHATKTPAENAKRDATKDAARGFDVTEVPIPKSRVAGRAVQVMAPRSRAADGSLPVLVLLHGLGETREERAGLFAWLGPYGLARAWERLADPPIVREREAYLTEAELSTINQSLANDPFRGLVVVCPYMPNPYAGGDSPTRIERYAETLMRDVLPAVYERIPAASQEPRRTGIAGVSLGGAVALEVYVRRPAAFGCLGTVQGAYGVGLAPALARRIAEAGGLPGRSVYVATSDSDPYCAANERLSRELETRGVPVRFSRRKGPHSQGWLVEIGSLELLSWHDRALRGQVETGRVRGG